MTQTPLPDQQAIVYPATDGQPMVDNSKQYRWVVRLCENLRRLYQDQAVCVEADMFWYPVKQQPAIKNAPDVFVALGRPPGDRSSYLQWEEGNVAPQVVIEIISPGNTAEEMAKKQDFYAEYGVLEILFYNPETYDFWGFVRQDTAQDLTLLLRLNLPWTSPTLGIRLEMTSAGLDVFYPNGDRFLDVQDIFAERDTAQQERDTAQRERDAAQQERDAAQQERDRLAAKLRELGVDPDQL